MYYGKFNCVNRCDISDDEYFVHTDFLIELHRILNYSYMFLNAFLISIFVLYVLFVSHIYYILLHFYIYVVSIFFVLLFCFLGVVSFLFFVLFGYSTIEITLYYRGDFPLNKVIKRW